MGTSLVLATLVGVLIAGYILIGMGVAKWGLSRYKIQFVKKPPVAPPAATPDAEPKPGSGTGVAPDAEDSGHGLASRIKTFLIRGLIVIGIALLAIVVFLFATGELELYRNFLETPRLP